MLCLLGVAGLCLRDELLLHLCGLDRKAPKLLVLHIDHSLGLLQLVRESFKLASEARLVALVLLDDLQGLEIPLLLCLECLGQSLDLEPGALLLGAHRGVLSLDL